MKWVLQPVVNIFKAVSNIAQERFVLKLSYESIADMLFGGSIAKAFIDVLFDHKDVICKTSIHK